MRKSQDLRITGQKQCVGKVVHEFINLLAGVKYSVLELVFPITHEISSVLLIIKSLIELIIVGEFFSDRFPDPGNPVS